eukprot:7383323-Prymnesium_polylepis.2
MCVSPVCPWQCQLSRPAERCRRMCQEPCLEWGERLLGSLRTAVWKYTARDTHACPVRVRCPVDS